MSDYHITPEESIRLNACRWLSINDGVVGNYRQAPEGSETEMLADLTAGDTVYTIGYNKLDIAELIGGYDLKDDPVVIEGEITTDTFFDAFLIKYSLPIRREMFSDLVIDGIGTYTLTVPEDLFIKGSLQVEVSDPGDLIRPEIEYMLNGTLKQTGRSKSQIDIPVLYSSQPPSRVMAVFPQENGNDRNAAIELGHTIVLKGDWTLTAVVESRHPSTDRGDLACGILRDSAGSYFSVAWGRLELNDIRSYTPSYKMYSNGGPYIVTATRIDNMLYLYVNTACVHVVADTKDRKLDRLNPGMYGMLRGIRFFKYGKSSAEVGKLVSEAYCVREYRYTRPMYDWPLEEDGKNRGQLSFTACLGTFEHIEHNGHKLAKFVSGAGFESFYFPAGINVECTFAIDVWYGEDMSSMGFFNTRGIDRYLSNTYVNPMLYNGLYLRPGIYDNKGKIVCYITKLPTQPTIFTDRPNRLVLVRKNYYECTAYINGTPVQRYSGAPDIRNPERDTRIIGTHGRYVDYFGSSYDYNSVSLKNSLMFKNLQFFDYPMTDAQVLKHYNDEPYDALF